MEIRDLGTIREEHKIYGHERPKSRPSVERSYEFFSIGGERSKKFWLCMP